MLPLGFEQSINTFKSSASAFYCYQICKKKVREFKILAILYFYCVFIIFILTLQQVLLAIVLNKVRNFVHICPVALFHLHLTLYNKNSLWIKSIRPSSFALSILYFSQGNFTNWKHSSTIFYYIVKKQQKSVYPPLPINQMFECFVITLLKWMKYKNRLTFAYYSINILRF